MRAEALNGHLVKISLTDKVNTMDFGVVDWDQTLSYFISILIAYVLALPIGWDREKEDRSAGLRTFPLVAIASCGYILIAEQVVGSSAEGQARILEGLMTGIGFIGAGAILKGSGSVHGTATAASVWNTGAVGAAVAYGRYEIAIVLSLANFLTLRYLAPFKSAGKGDEVKADR